MLLALSGAAACSSASAPDNTRATAWSISPASANLAAGGTDTLTVTVWAGPGQLLNPIPGGWDIFVSQRHCLVPNTQSCGALALSLLAGSSNPRRYRLDALSPTTDTLAFDYEVCELPPCTDPIGCPCVWTPTLPGIAVPVSIH